mgnify:CR=1 FL=1
MSSAPTVTVFIRSKQRRKATKRPPRKEPAEPVQRSVDRKEIDVKSGAMVPVTMAFVQKHGLEELVRDGVLARVAADAFFGL